MLDRGLDEGIGELERIRNRDVLDASTPGEDGVLKAAKTSAPDLHLLDLNALRPIRRFFKNDLADAAGTLLEVEPDIQGALIARMLVELGKRPHGGDRPVFIKLDDVDLSQSAKLACALEIEKGIEQGGERFLRAQGIDARTYDQHAKTVAFVLGLPALLSLVHGEAIAAEAMQQSAPQLADGEAADFAKADDDGTRREALIVQHHLGGVDHARIKAALPAFVEPAFQGFVQVAFGAVQTVLFIMADHEREA